jgi:ATP-dependent DNA helicase RecG
MKNYYAEFEGQLKEEAILNALVAENLGKVKQNLSDSEEKSLGKRVVRKGGQKLTGKQQELLDMLRQSPSISRKKLSNLLKINESAVQKRLETLKKKGVLKRKGAAKGGSWQIIGR